MNDSRRQVLQMLADGKITAEEAERLLSALESNAATGGNGARYAGAASAGDAEPAKPRPKYLRVLVESQEGESGKNGPTSVNIRVPMRLLRAGVRLASLIPAQAHEHLDQALNKQGIPLTLSQIKPENLEELVDSLDDLTVDVTGKESSSNANVKVRVFSE
ncbi:hypothetical protein ACFPT7_20775 [Acidicapsa dinghuensis]|uniref:YvlB/LiaX N-terminal domain-containing protein n=1 Tax=Acidicapsa dinghuensis TaxID=2218256 RepID=A0ABW1EKK0_9BACT|nr:hypothetical protein [Acidicapsa dinghuensis]